MELNIKSVALLLLLSATASVGQGREVHERALDEEVQEREIDKRAVDGLTCVWNAVKGNLPSSPTGTACAIAGSAVVAAANIPCVKKAVDPVLDGLVNKLKNYFKSKCSLTLSKIKNWMANDSCYVKAHMPTVLLMAIGGMLATKRYIF